AFPRQPRLSIFIDRLPLPGGMTTRSPRGDTEPVSGPADPPRGGERSVSTRLIHDRGRELVDRLDRDRVAGRPRRLIHDRARELVDGLDRDGITNRSAITLPGVESVPPSECPAGHPDKDNQRQDEGGHDLRK